jgi:crossover junction endodeoxyribonuclease RusA
MRKIVPPIDTAKFIEATRRARITEGDGWRRLVLPYPPSVNRMYRMVVIKGQGRMLISGEGRKYKHAAERIAAASGITPFAGRLYVVVDLYRPRQAGDIDNSFKALLDSITGVGWEDDSQIKGICAIQHEDKDNPRAVVRIRLADGETLNFAEFLK